MSEWIPISERLPDENERRKSYDRTKHASEFIVMIEGGTNPTTLYLTMDNYWKDNDGVFYSVRAWMTLPQPYREDDMTRGDAIQILADLIDNPFLHTWEEQNKALHMAIEALFERTGEWILECDSEGEGDNLYRCSECGCKYGCQEYDKPNFCLDCGANMNKGGEK